MNRLLLSALAAAFACSVSSLPLAAVAESAGPGGPPALGGTFSPAVAVKLGSMAESAQFGPSRILPVTKAEQPLDPTLFSPLLTGEAEAPAQPVMWAANESDYGLGGALIAHETTAMASIDRCNAALSDRATDLVPDTMSIKACGERLGEVLEDLRQERWQYSYLTAAELAPICVSADSGESGSLTTVCDSAMDDNSAYWVQAKADIDRLMNASAFDLNAGEDRSEVFAQREEFTRLFAWTGTFNIPVIAAGDE